MNGETLSAVPRVSGSLLIWLGGADGRLWVAAGVAALILLTVLYRAERRLVPRGIGLTLLGLRLAAALALISALFEPAARRTHNETVRGRIILGVDRSDSMETADTPNGATRREIVRRLLEQDWLKSLIQQGDLEALAFARETTPGTIASMTQAAPDDPARLITDWTGVLDHALIDRQGQPVTAVILLTDGLQNSANAEAAEHTLGRLKTRGIPVHAVWIGATSPPRDVAIAAVRAPETVERGQSARIEATIKLDGLPAGTEVPVVLERPGAPPLRQVVRAPADRTRPTAAFSLPFETQGVSNLTLVVGPVPGDARADNDRQPLRVVVTDDQVIVLLVSGEAGWDFQYLRNALRRDPHVKLEAIVLRQPRGPDSAGSTYPSAWPTGPETMKDPLESVDAIIIGDLDPTDLSAEAWQHIERHVGTGGASLILTAGPRGWPALAEQATLAKLLPLRAVRPVPVDAQAIDPKRPALPAGIRIEPDPAALGGTWPMLQLSTDPDHGAGIWAELPGLPWMLAGTIKPTATALAFAVPDSTATVIAAMPYGLGKVLWIGTDGTWRWRFRAGDAVHHRFWGQVAAWAARDKLSAGNRSVQFGAVPPRVPEGAPVVIRARFDETVAPPPPLVVAQVLPNAKAESAERDPPIPVPVAVIALQPRGDPPGVLEGSVPTLPPGSYRVRLDVPQLANDQLDNADAATKPTAPLEVIPRASTERIELTANPDAIRRLANATGGRVFTPDDIDALPATLKTRTIVRAKIETTRLWDRPEALIAFVAILTIEWLLKKRAGLP